MLIRDLAVVLLIAGGAAWLCRRLRLSAVVGYLLAGAVIGPYTPPFALVTDLDRVQTLAQLGLVFLTFWIGLGLSLGRLRNLGLSVILATAIGALLVLSASRVVGWYLGWSATAALFLAGTLMVSSSAVISKVLDELNLTHERPGQLALGVTVLEDAVAVVMLTVLTSVVHMGTGKPGSVLSTLGSLGAFVVILGLLSLLLAPRVLDRVSRVALPEVRTLVVGGALLALAWWSVSAGYSLALGAFVFGAILGSTRYKADVERAFDGVQQLFGAVFFVAAGMQVDFRVLVGAWPLVLGIAALAWIVRPVACTLGLVAVGNRGREAFTAGMALTPLGEFSFIIAQMGVAAGITPPSFYAAAVGGGLLTALAAPFLTRRGESLGHRMSGAAPPWLVDWARFYHDWLTRWQSRGNTSTFWRLASRRLRALAVHVLLVSGLLLFARPVYLEVRETLGRDWLGPGSLPFIFWSAFGLLLLGPLIAIWRHVAVLAMMVAENATQGSRRALRLRPLLEAALRVIAVVLLGVWLVALTPPGWTLPGAAGAVLLVLGVLAAVFWRRFIHLHSRFEIELRRQLQRASHRAATSAWVLEFPDPVADWQVDIDEVTLPGDSALVGRTLGELGIRQRFGCSVVGIDRQGFGLANPGAGTMVFPQDKLLLLGTAGQLAAAAKHLSATGASPASAVDFDALAMETVRVPEGSPLARRPLAELDLIRRAGVQIGGIRRGKSRNLSPRGGDHFEDGDELLVLGTHAQIKAFVGELAPAVASAARD